MNTTRYVPPHDSAAIQNLDANWHAIFEKCGIKIVVLRVNARRGTKAHHHVGLEMQLGQELEAAGIAMYDSTFYPGCVDESASGHLWHFFHAFDLGKTMQFLKTRLQALGLLANCIIAHAEGPHRLAIWYAPDASIIGTVIDDEAMPT